MRQDCAHLAELSCADMTAQHPGGGLGGVGGLGLPCQLACRRHPDQERVEVVVALRLCGRTPSLVEHAAEELRQLCSQVRGLRYGKPVPERVQEPPEGTHGIPMVART